MVWLLLAAASVSAYWAVLAARASSGRGDGRRRAVVAGAAGWFVGYLWVVSRRRAPGRAVATRTGPLARVTVAGAFVVLAVAGFMSWATVETPLTSSSYGLDGFIPLLLVWEAFAIAGLCGALLRPGVLTFTCATAMIVFASISAAVVGGVARVLAGTGLARWGDVSVGGGALTALAAAVAATVALGARLLRADFLS